MFTTETRRHREKQKHIVISNKERNLSEEKEKRMNFWMEELPDAGYVKGSKEMERGVLEMLPPCQEMT